MTTQTQNPYAMLQGNESTVELPEGEDYLSVEAFVEYCLRVGVRTFTPGDAQKIALQPPRPLKSVMDELKSYGLTVVKGVSRSEVRGFTSNSHNRWDGNECAGGSGWEVIAGFAGRAG